MHIVLRYAVTWILAVSLSLYSVLGYTVQTNNPHLNQHLTAVERKFIAASDRQPAYPSERIVVIETKNPYELGKITALRFIEWAITNPNGVIALTSGATPEYFIKFLHYYKQNWHDPKVQAELHSFGINRKNFPDTSNMKFVQLEEFFPISPKHSKNVANYIRRYYIKILGLKPENVLLMDLTSKGILAEKGLKVVFMNGKVDLRIMQRKASSQLELWQQQAIQEARSFCKDYERRIRAWGGIDFYLGSLGYGGDLGFNKPGTEFDSKTHIVTLDYIAAAHAAKDLGGIEHSKGKVAVTIGLGTVAFKPDATRIIIASGESKAPMVRDAVEMQPNVKIPATTLQKFPTSRFYITASAASMLRDRQLEDLKNRSKQGWNEQLLAEVITEIALAEKKQIITLTEADLKKYPIGVHLLETMQNLPTILHAVRAQLVRGIEAGVNINSSAGKKVLHTAPHHDDIMVGYFPIIDSLLKNYQNKFAYFTSGFNSVPDSYILSVINRASDWWLNKEADTIFNKPYSKVIAKFRNYYLRQDQAQIDMLDTIIALKHLVDIYDIKNIEQLKQTIRWLKDDYFPNKQPGDMDVASIKLLKGMIRESEVDRKWTLKNVPLDNVTHLRSPFYTGKEFTTTPRIETDISPFVNLYNTVRPDILTVQDDPNSAPPITHYKALQVVAQGLRNSAVLNNPSLQIWGYRNIWFRYKAFEANAYVPVSEKMLETQRRVFMACFHTQRTASFPSPFIEGDFSTLSSMIQKEQRAELKTLLGEEYFRNHPNLQVRNATGFIYFKQMTLHEFLQRAEDLQSAIELEETFESLSA